MTRDFNDWWGVRLRLVFGDEEPPPPTASERLAAGLIISALLGLIWLLRLVAWPTAAFVRDEVVVPLSLALIAPALFLTLPWSWPGLAEIGALLVLSRESGRLKRLDSLLAILSGASVSLAIWRIKSPLAPALLVTSTTTLLAYALLAVFQPRIDATGRRWTPRLPPWLLLPGSGEVVGPEPGAKPVYELRINGDRKYPVGVVIPEDALSKLRTLNREAGGRLFQENLPAVVLVDRPPVEGAGREPLTSLCLQIASAAAAHGLTPYSYANAVLRFVQEAISYKHDDESTESFEGGPFVEYGRFALETLHDAVGDCECTAILCASLLSYLGFGTALIYVTFDEDGEITHHAAVGLSVSDGLLAGDEGAEGFESFSASDGSELRFLYGETAIDGGTLAFGVVPRDGPSVMKVDSVVPVPRLGIA